MRISRWNDYFSFIVATTVARLMGLMVIVCIAGHDTSHHALACFGGAGGQHACSIARSLGMKTVHVHKYSSILSAYGMALADVVHDTQRHCGVEFSAENWSKIDELMETLKTECRVKLGEQGFKEPLLEPYLHLRCV